MRVEGDLIPDHLLIDHRPGAAMGEALAAVIETVAEKGGECHAVVMRSCITAGIEGRATSTSSPR